MRMVAWKLRGEAQRLQYAAERLDDQDSWHLEHARQLINLVSKELELCVRQIDREQKGRIASVKQGG